MRLRLLLPVAPLAFLVLVGATASRPPAASSPGRAARQAVTSSATTPSATSSSGPTRCGCTRSLPTLDPETALAVGLKVDVEALPPDGRGAQGRAGRSRRPGDDGRAAARSTRSSASWARSATAGTARRASASPARSATRRSTTRSSPGIGKRLDGWANRDLNVGAIIALSPALDAATKAEFKQLGTRQVRPAPPRFDGTNIIPLNAPSLPIVIPPIYGLKGVGFETVHGRWADLVLERLRRRRPDGRPGHVQRSAPRDRRSCSRPTW